jgi:hypothetical protein
MLTTVRYKVLAMEKDVSLEKTPAALGGEARAANLSTERKRAIGKLAADARWGADLPRATHDGPLQIGDATLMAAVLANGKRLIVQGTMLTAIGRSRTPKAGTGGSVNVDGLPFFLSADILKPFITEELRLSTSITPLGWASASTEARPVKLLAPMPEALQQPCFQIPARWRGLRFSPRFGCQQFA